MLTEAREFQNSDEARVEAARRIGFLLQEHSDELWADEDWQMEVTDDRGLIVFAINIQALKPAAIINFKSSNSN